MRGYITPTYVILVLTATYVSLQPGSHRKITDRKSITGDKKKRTEKEKKERTRKEDNDAKI